SSNNKLIVQQYSKPMTVANVISAGNLLTVGTSSTQNTLSSSTPIIVTNANTQTNQIIDKKRKHDCKFSLH
ncbi:unnamed protein product, partial [Rotaria magnacalcarata]